MMDMCIEAPLIFLPGMNLMIMLGMQAMLARFFSAEILSQHCEERLGLSGKGGVPVLAARIAKAWQKASFVLLPRKRSLVVAEEDEEVVGENETKAENIDRIDGNVAKRLKKHKQGAADEEEETG